MQKFFGVAKLLPIVCGAALCVALGLGIGYAWQRVAADFPLGWGASVWTLHSILENELQREVQLLDQFERIRREAAAKQWVKEELIAQRITLREAMAHFRHLSVSTPRYVEHLRRAYRGQSDEENIGRNVLAHVQEALAKYPARAAIVLPRLEDELRALVTPYEFTRLEPTDWN